MKKSYSHYFVLLFLFLCLPELVTGTGLAKGKTMTGEGPNLVPRITQSEFLIMDLPTKIAHGLRIFTTPFNKKDGYGDGRYDPSEGDPIVFGNRPCLQNGIPDHGFDGRNGTFLRVNGLDGQTCLECHFITRNSTIPATLGIAGVAAGANNVLFMPRFINVADIPADEAGQFNGRFINPPFLFGSGGVELLAKEMTLDLQEIKAEAIANPGKVFKLITKDVYFGTIVVNGGVLDTSGVEGVDEDLVIRPFGRKGEFATVRAFDVGAVQFHFGIQPIEVVGETDADGDGVRRELLIGELSALHAFGTTRNKPIIQPLPGARHGFRIFKRIRCNQCHKPFLVANSTFLKYSFPEVETNPDANVYQEIDLAEEANFIHMPNGRMLVPLFADLKRHDMGDRLEESFDEEDEKFNREFTTARLWGVRDTAPYLHDGRATTITEAILMHGGEAQNQRDRFEALSDPEKKAVIKFLYSLRTPLDDEESDESFLQQ